MKNGTLEKFRYWFKNDQMAVAFCMDIVFIAHLWDDLIDKDKPICDDEINFAFIAALNTIPSNPFYRLHAGQLQTIIMSAILQWQTANILDAGSQEDIDKSFMLRASIYQIFHFTAYLIGGLQWANEIGPDVWRFYSEKKDSFLEVENA